jgi:hypothetical protein
MRIVDDEGHDADSGELWIGGPSVFSQYLGFSAQDMCACLDHGFYKTGDLVRRHQDHVYFVGRRDRQIKLRGQRVELEALERVIRACPGVLDVAVKVFNMPTGVVLACFVVSSTAVAAVRHHCVQQLPAWQVPSLIVCLPALPRTPNGKVNYAVLTLPSPMAPLSNTPLSGGVAILGGGVAGILTAMACTRRGIPYTMFESGATLGGVWVNGTARSDPAAPSSLQQPSEGYSLAGKLALRYPDTTAIVAHLNHVVTDYGIAQHAVMNASVVGVEARSQTGRMSVDYMQPEGMSTSTLDFDAVISCVGRFHTRHAVTPSWALGLVTEKHIWALRAPDVVGKNVVIVGGGAFAVEAVSTCLHYGARRVTLVARTPHPVVPRTWFESPVLTRLFWKLASGFHYERRCGHSLRALASMAVGRHYARAGIVHMFHQFAWDDQSLAVSDAFFENARRPNVEYIHGNVLGYNVAGDALTGTCPVKFACAFVATTHPRV